MSQEREGKSISASQALDTLRDLKSGYTRRHSRISDNQADEMTTQIRALQGLCGSCTKIDPLLYRDGPKSLKRIALRCNAGLSPVKLYEDTPITQKAICPGFTPQKPD